MKVAMTVTVKAMASQWWNCRIHLFMPPSISSGAARPHPWPPRVPQRIGARQDGTVETAADIAIRAAEVLALVVEHLSNAEIAARLFISVRTVESHISSLLRKLEVADRRALAQRAAELTAAERAQPVLPTPLTSFVGRVGER